MRLTPPGDASGGSGVSLVIDCYLTVVAGGLMNEPTPLFVRHDCKQRRLMKCENGKIRIAPEAGSKCPDIFSQISCFSGGIV